MTEIVGWLPITLRLALTLVAGFLIGINRGVHGEPAGLRTTLLVCLAASISMIQANLLARHRRGGRRIPTLYWI